MPAPARQGTDRALALVALIVLAAVISASCRSMFSRKYEYDEDVHLSLDGSATVYVNASVPALVALRGADLDVNPRARLDLDAVRAMYETPVTDVVSATGSRRDNRRYVHLRIEVTDIRRLGEGTPFAWSRYELDPHDDLVRFRQAVGPATGRDVGNVGWTGDEFVAFRVHLPSRVPFHNSPADIQRGNIIVWEQLLTDRLEGQPLAMEVHMEPESILVRTLTLFGITVALALATFALAIWWV
ncbi:MAG: hypothetical protein ACRD1H_12550, partial [Vicinamibacterales bacterium]